MIDQRYDYTKYIKSSAVQAVPVAMLHATMTMGITMLDQVPLT